MPSATVTGDQAVVSLVTVKPRSLWHPPMPPCIWRGRMFERMSERLVGRAKAVARRANALIR